MKATGLGRLVEEEWLATVRSHSFMKLDEYIVMPNHFHTILSFESRRETASPGQGTFPIRTQRFRAPPGGSVGSIVATFKSNVTKRANARQKAGGIQVWQRNYYERVVRNEEELNAIRAYIAYNPSQWGTDQENPSRIATGIIGKVFEWE